MYKTLNGGIMEALKLKEVYAESRDRFAQMLISATGSKLDVDTMKSALDSGLETSISTLANKDRNLAEALFVLASDKGIKYNERIELSRSSMPADLLDRVLPDASLNAKTSSTSRYLNDLLAGGKVRSLRIDKKDAESEQNITQLTAAFMEYFAYKTALLTHHGEKFDLSKFYGRFVELDKDVATRVHGQLGGTEQSQDVIINAHKKELGEHTRALEESNRQLEFALRQRLLS